MKRLNLELNSKKVVVWAERIKGTLWVHWQGQTYSIPPVTSRRGTSVNASTNPGRITSPMPGKVTKVLTRVGATVAKGSALVVIEAMKMEYTLSADIGGAVEILNCIEGDLVPLGQVLVVLQPTTP